MKKNIKTPFANVSWEGSKYPPLGLILFFIAANLFAFALVGLVTAGLALCILSLALYGASFWPIFWLTLVGTILVASLAND